MRYAKRVDANQDQIVSVLRAAGAYVWIIGLPVDLLVGYKNKTILPIWLLSIILGIFSYLVVMYYITYPKLI